MTRPHTVAYLIKDGTRLFARCKHCDRLAPTDLQSLGNRLGFAFRPGEEKDRLERAMHCTDCGLKGATVEFRLPDGILWDGSGAHRGNRAPD